MDFITQWVTIFQPAMNQAIANEQAVINTCRGAGAFLISLAVGTLVIVLIAAYNVYHNKQRRP